MTLSKTPSQITVRPVTSEQYEKIKRTVYDIINVAFKSDDSWTTDRAFVSIDRIPTAGEAEFDARCKEPNVLLCAFDEQDQIVGVIHIQVQGSEALLNCLGVSPSHQSRGVGSLLIRESVKHIQANMPTIKEAVVHVFVARPELTTWYVRMGFKDVGEVIPFPYGDILIVDEAPLVILRYDVRKSL
ncbi:unnamed protein product [Mucor circinelloides]|uniref:N-acetyltransferase domain-containing protein n=1 Tax=Mucor circinelloides f. circinelloides (strain 1006PhL) TaxID=1220926 RepID=S2JN86_MUCC1|nr:hypothetical protein HMPREF1544_09184 [Mucor circinelloides 1006PhL]KAG1103210.1 hypothetical protein G6F42_017252 [Rhizopus arrhizus]